MTSVARVCTVPDCSKTLTARGLCAAHYAQWRRNRTDGPVCIKFACTQAAVSLSMCDKHYQEFRVSDPSATRCKIVGCDNAATANAMCNMHNLRFTAGGDLFRPVKAMKRRTELNHTCTISNCDNEWSTSAVCKKHRAQIEKYHLSPVQLDMVLRTGCLICGTFEKLTIDHDHKCCPRNGSCGSCVRGALCNGCNVALGAFNDDIEKLRAAITYLSR